ncbi:pseudouridine synthase [Atopococcus tabaci]|uniref:pseudouridine synthase n=1 Tax=Atopococcus tabaci TaxID=269774 RepID=UPI000428D0FA|nr:pseudouridine synthase [Atopococcus tabaci]
MRIDKLLAHSGFGTRKEVKKLLKSKLVWVNEEPVTDPKVHVNPEEDEIAVGGEPVHYQEFVYFMMNKPQDVISATEDVYHHTVIDLLEPQDSIQEPFPVGRLDIDTEGFLLLTNDGALAHQLLSPKKHVDKVYEAVVDGIVTEADKEAFAKGVTLDDGYETLPAELEILSVDEEAGQSHTRLTIHEGKFHQVKRMFEAVGKEVTHLTRISMGPLELDPALELGQYRALTKEEISLLKGE